jgi:4-hydroxy-3-methylbut-2-en-1-yl diphosphate reductase
VIFSAHGVPRRCGSQAKERNLEVIDATCPLVTKVHLEAVEVRARRLHHRLIGHKDHDEVIGTLGEAPESTIPGGDRGGCRPAELPTPARPYMTQTTLSLDETRTSWSG